VRRAGLAFLFVVPLLLAGMAAAGVREDPPPTTTSTTTTTTTSTTTTTPAPTTTTAPTTTVAPPPAQVLPPGVEVGGVAVGGMTATSAFLVLQDSFPQTLTVTVAGRRLVVQRARLGATDYLWNALTKARSAASGTDVPVVTSVKGAAVREYVAKLKRRFDRAPVDATLRLRGVKPLVTKDRPGFRIEAGPATAALLSALKSHVSAPVPLPSKRLPASVTRRDFGPVIVIERSSNRLQLYRGTRPWRLFTVATGQTVYPTPLGRFAIVAMWKNPWWYPPDSPWAAGEKPVPPGPGNPLGTRWMGLSAPGVGIHGTPDAASLGYSASHGCIRMGIPDAEWLFDHVAVGTPVFIVPA
jgi:lipoprotein-anchoring transpeptidase ErfK/SrfK